MSFIKNYILKILIISTILVGFYSCENISTPLPDSSVLKLKTEKKWKVDPQNDNRLYVVKVKQYDIIGNMVFSEEYNSEGNVNSQSTYTYNDLTGSKEEKIIYNNDGSAKHNLIIEYTYNENKKVTKKVEYDSSGKVSSVFEYNYDNNGNLIRKDEKTSNGGLHTVNYDYTYNNKGDLVERKIINNGTLVNRDSLYYNSSQNSFDVINLNHSTGLIESKTSYIYNNQGLILTETELNSNGTIVNKYIYEYLYYSK